MSGVFKDIESATVLRNLTLRLFEGEITFFLGPSGSGKTVLAHMLSGLLQPDSGVIRVMGKCCRIRSRERAQSLGIYYVSSDAKLIPFFSMSNNIAVSHHEWRLALRYRSHVDRRVAEACRDLGMAIDLEKRPSSDSFFDILKVECVRALFRKDRILIFDNILYLLSIEETAEFFRLVNVLSSRGITVLFMEPTEKCALKYAHRILFLREGLLVSDMSREECSPQIALTLLHTDVPRPPLPEAGRQSGGNVQRFRFPSREGSMSVDISPGCVLGLTCPSFREYRWYLSNAFQKKVLDRENPQLPRGVTVLTKKSIRSDVFLDLSTADNIMLPALRHISRLGMINNKRLHTFFNSEYAGFLDIDEAGWDLPLKYFGYRERELVVLSRALMQGSSIIVLAGITDEPNASLGTNLQNFIRVAANRNKSVVFIGRENSILQDWCDDIRNI